MKEKIITLLEKYKSLIRYGIFGALTTIINIAAYAVVYHKFGISNVVSNIIAWVLAVVFAFVTNKLWVFDSKTLEIRTLLFELTSFFACRLATGLLDLAIMYVAVDKMAFNSTIMKCLSNIFVIIANYIFSKLVIFKKKKV